MKAVKWIAIIVGGLITLVIVALLVIPAVVDVEKYKPQIEQRVTDSLGRPFRVAGDMDLSLFPWAGVALSDVHLANPEGFEDKDFVNVKSFEVRVKLLPLISRQVEVQKFILDSPRIELIKREDGKGNWEGLGKPEGPQAERPTAPEAEKPKQPEGEKPSRMPIESLAVDEFVIKNGSVLWIDQTTGSRKEIRDFRLELEDVSFDEKIEIEMSAELDGAPVSLEGTVGPVGRVPGEGVVPIKIQVKALKEMEVELTGTIQDAASNPAFEMDLAVSPFSPGKLMSALGQPLPVATTDSGALNSLSLSMKMKGDKQKINIINGTINLDDSKILFSATAKEFDKPDLAFELNVDKINADRYLPPPGDEQPSGKEETPPREAGKEKDYEPLRRMVLDGKITFGDLQVKGANIQDVEMKVTGRDGLFRLDPLAMNMYQGSLAGNGAFDVRSETPESRVNLEIKGIEANPLLQDLAQKDFIEGMLVANLAISMKGDEPQQVKETLGGEGELVFTDGAIKGVNLTALVQKLKSAVGFAEAGEVSERTDFSELRVPFTITNGVMQMQGATMMTPLMRMEATGKADLVQETLDFRVVPKLVASLEGKGDTRERIGVLVPILVTGTFASPKFMPDVKGVAKEQMEKKVEDLLKGEEGEKAIPSKERIDDLLKKLPFNE